MTMKGGNRQHFEFRGIYFIQDKIKISIFILLHVDIQFSQ